MFFSDLHVQLLARGILNPGEQLVGQTVTSYMPWWAFGLVRRQYLVLATDQRLILVDHRYSFLRPTVQRLHAVDSITWSNLQELKVKGVFLKKKLRVRGAGEQGPINLTMPIPNALFGLLAPMKDNMAGARGIAAGFEVMQAAPALPAPASQGAYGQPQISYTPPAPQLGAPQAHPIPAQNAPGYASAPPPAPGPYGVTPPLAGPPSAPQGYPPPRSWS